MVRRSKRNQKFQWPCGTCGSECGDDTIYCDGCMVWYHTDCDNLSVADLKSMSKFDEDYLCSSCTKIAGFDGALLRLKTYKGSLATRMKVEAIYLKRTPFQLTKRADIDGGREDVVSTAILMGSGGLHGRRPVHVSRDGNCLFNALSLSFIGDESAASELRLRTCLEMLKFKSFYTQTHQHTGIPLVSPDYIEACRECAVDGGYSSAWTVHAAATVLGVPIQTVYPPVNGMMDKCIPILNTTFVPRRRSHSKEAIVIMWTSVNRPTLGTTWSPNHFVPLLAISNLDAYVDLLDEPENPSYADVVKSPQLFQKNNKEFQPHVKDDMAKAKSPAPPAARPGNLNNTELPSSDEVTKTKFKQFFPSTEKDSRAKTKSTKPPAAQPANLSNTELPSSNDATKTKFNQFVPSANNSRAKIKSTKTPEKHQRPNQATKPTPLSAQPDSLSNTELPSPRDATNTESVPSAAKGSRANTKSPTPPAAQPGNLFNTELPPCIDATNNEFIPSAKDSRAKAKVPTLTAAQPCNLSNTELPSSKVATKAKFKQFVPSAKDSRAKIKSTKTPQKHQQPNQATKPTPLSAQPDSLSNTELPSHRDATYTESVPSAAKGSRANTKSPTPPAAQPGNLFNTELPPCLDDTNNESVPSAAKGSRANTKSPTPLAAQPGNPDATINNNEHNEPCEHIYTRNVKSPNLTGARHLDSPPDLSSIELQPLDASETEMGRYHWPRTTCTQSKRDRSLGTTYTVQEDGELERSDQLETSLSSFNYANIDPRSSTPHHNDQNSVSLLHQIEGSDIATESPILLGAIQSNGRFMDPEDVLDTMLNREPTSNKIPYGVKENVVFLLNNEDNVARQQVNRKAMYVDDCGSWGVKTSMKTHYYLIHSNSLQYIELRNGQYFVNVKKQRVVLDPQPEEDHIISFKRYYQKLKRDETYKRRISIVWKCPDTLNHVKHLAVIEYVGIYPTTSAPHGNAKTSKTDYIRTKQEVQDKIHQLVETNMPRDVYTDMLLDGSTSAPRDLKQVQNARYIKQKHNHGGHHRRNHADDIQTLLSTFHNHPFMQEIIQTKQKNPSVILYLEDNLMDIKQFCTTESSHPCVMGIDRTFNLGSCYVTIIVYQHNNLLRKISQTHPIMLACAYLHWDGKYETYHRFFSHLQSRLNGSINGVQLKNLVVGSDEEVALTKAIHDCFPGSQQVLCVRHLEENVRRYLAHKIGTDDKSQQSILQDIFGSEGITQSKSVEEYNLHMSELLDKYSLNIPDFVEYFKKVSDKIRESVVKPRQCNKWIPLNWKNNSCESMNHILKLSANWRSLKLPDLIDRLYKIVQVQQADMRRSLYGHGNYQLAPWMMKLYVRPSIWAQKSEEEKYNLFKKFMKGAPRRLRTIVSTDGLLELPQTPKTAKKPGQRKRVKTERTLYAKTLF